MAGAVGCGVAVAATTTGVDVGGGLVGDWIGVAVGRSVATGIGVAVGSGVFSSVSVAGWSVGAGGLVGGATVSGADVTEVCVGSGVGDKAAKGVGTVGAEVVDVIKSPRRMTAKAISPTQNTVPTNVITQKGGCVRDDLVAGRRAAGTACTCPGLLCSGGVFERPMGGGGNGLS